MLFRSSSEPEEKGTRVVTLYSQHADREIRSNGTLTWVGEDGMRVGGGSSSTESAAVFVFNLPELRDGETITSAILTAKLNKITGGPTGQVDVHGIDFGLSPQESTKYFYAGPFNSENKSYSWALQSGFAKNNSASGDLNTSSAASSRIAAYISNQYLNGAVEEDEVYIRLNSSNSNESDFRYWEFASSDDSSNQPILTLEIDYGYKGYLPSNPISSPANRSTHIENTSITFALNESLRSHVPDTNDIVWLSNIDGQIGSGYSFSTKALSLGVHSIQAIWFNTSGAILRETITVEVKETSFLGGRSSSLSQGGVTWYFDKEYQVGRFANGEHYVVAPSGLTLTRISPAWDGTKNGAEINPVGLNREKRQGLDRRIQGLQYDEDLNVADNLPLQVATNSSVLSALGRDSQSSGGLWIEDAPVLTILPSAPPANSFRPPYAGSDKRIIGTKDDIDFSFLQNLTPPSRVAEPSARLDHTIIELISEWENSDLKSVQGEHYYGRQISYGVADAALWLNLDHTIAEKQPVLVDIIQRGIDNYGSVKSGTVFYPNGGHNLGRKLPVLMAGRALNDAEMLEWADPTKHLVFQEDMQHLIVDQNIVNKNSNYNSSHLGMPEWIFDPIGKLEDGTPFWETPYRDVNGGPNIGTALAAELMGLRDDWNYEPFFRYLEERFWQIEEGNRGNWYNEIFHFHAEMWELYKK